MTLPAHWLKALIRAKKSSKQLRMRSSYVLTATVLSLGALHSSSVSAGTIVGATEFTQIANNMELVLQYAQQVQQYETQLQQYQAQLKNLENNVGGSLSSNPAQIIQGVGSIMSATNSIGSTLNQIDAKFSQQYNNPTAGNYASRYQGITNATMGSLGAAMRAAGLHRDAYSSDAAALQALYNQSQNSSGTTAAVQQLAGITAMQVQQTQKLGDLLSTQALATNSWMAGQARNNQSAADNDAAIRQGFVDASAGGAPVLDVGKKTYKKQNLYSPQ